MSKHKCTQVAANVTLHSFVLQVLALFANGRIEDWLDCSCSSPQEMCSPAFVPRIARQLRRFHALDVDLPKTPHTPWGVIRNWLANAKTLKFTDPVKQAAYKAIDFAALERDCHKAEAVCALTNSPIVFGHNDLLSGNILVLQQPGFDPQNPNLDGPICFIDYEYGAYTHRGFDIGNHFAEYAGFEGDYTRYPSKQQQELFFRHYLAANPADVPPPVASVRASSNNGSNDGNSSSSSSGGSSEVPPLDAEQLHRLSAEANVWSLASHLYWGVWAVIQACYSPIDFDYIQFSKTRLGEYQRRKDQFLSEAQQVFGANPVIASHR
eukprot:GHRR01022767.1.p1 GENE.GHRR01022767.1~~GHRR01022767.1.p1  ORF type:complete len:323 (+),score=84.31 GHRR01022767.1:302-1270(+)